MPGNSIRQCIALVGWAPKSEALGLLLGREPKHEEDLSATIAVWEACQRAVAERPKFTDHDTDSPISPLPQEFEGAADSFRQRIDVQIETAQNTWNVAMLDVGRAISFQKIVYLDGGSAPVPTDCDLATLWELCLPPHLPFDLDPAVEKTSVTFTASSPNLRAIHPVFGLHGDRLPESGLAQPARAFGGFSIGYGATFVNARRFRGRVFLANGYHRAYRALRAGITHIPCVIFEVESESAAVPDDRGRYLPREVLFGDRPPLVADFLDPSVTRQVAVPAMRRVVRVTVDEFTIPESDGRSR